MLILYSEPNQGHTLKDINLANYYLQPSAYIHQSLI